MTTDNDHEFSLDFTSNEYNSSSNQPSMQELIEAIRVYELNRENERTAPRIQRKAERKMVLPEHRDRNPVKKRYR